jgi:hypothetical protein
MKASEVTKSVRITKQVKLNEVALPPGYTLSDLFMDGQQVMQELNITSRTLQNWRTTSKISYTKPFGKIYYFRQEIAGLLMKAKQSNKK